jgi:cupin 2 domain-containing protein
MPAALTSATLDISNNGSTEQTTMHSLHNLFANLPSELPIEAVTELASHGNVRIERIVSHGHASPDGFWYDQDQHEWVSVLQGKAKLEIEGIGVLELGPGDSILIDAHQRHRVVWTTPSERTIWLAVFFGP